MHLWFCWRCSTVSGVHRTNALHYSLANVIHSNLLNGSFKTKVSIAIHLLFLNFYHQNLWNSKYASKIFLFHYTVNRWSHVAESLQALGQVQAWEVYIRKYMRRASLYVILWFYTKSKDISNRVSRPFKTDKNETLSRDTPTREWKKFVIGHCKTMHETSPIHGALLMNTNLLLLFSFSFLYQRFRFLSVGSIVMSVSTQRAKQGWY